MNWKSEKQEEDIKLSIYLNYSCSLHAEYLWYIRKDFFKQISASYGAICVTLIKITLIFKIGNCDKHHL